MTTWVSSARRMRCTIVPMAMRPIRDRSGIRSDDRLCRGHSNKMPICGRQTPPAIRLPTADPRDAAPRDRMQQRAQRESWHATPRQVAPQTKPQRDSRRTPTTPSESTRDDETTYYSPGFGQPDVRGKPAPAVGRQAPTKECTPYLWSAPGGPPFGLGLTNGSSAAACGMQYKSRHMAFRPGRADSKFMPSFG